MRVDVLAFGPHPDDVELLCGGTVAKLVRFGYKVGLVDLTEGELGTRGSGEERAREAQEAAKIIFSCCRLYPRPLAQLPSGSLSRYSLI